jgi:hypothetical protein
MARHTTTQSVSDVSDVSIKGGITIKGFNSLILSVMSVLDY